MGRGRMITVGGQTESCRDRSRMVVDGQDHLPEAGPR